MPRNFLRVPLFLLLLLAAVLAPLVASGYSELRQAPAAQSYFEMARHYEAAALRLPWRADLYELAGHAYYHAREYPQAEAAYRKTYGRNALTPDGWVAWGDVAQGDAEPEPLHPPGPRTAPEEPPPDYFGPDRGKP